MGPKIEQEPIYQKARDIVELVNAFRLILEDRENSQYDDHILLQKIIDEMWNSALMIPPKLASALSEALYDLKMENATLIRMHARSLRSACSSLLPLGFNEPDYIQLLKNEIEGFRILFVEWVDTFDPWDYLIDRWGLFNPPGVTAYTKDPDDDIPFDTQLWEEE